MISKEVAIAVKNDDSLVVHRISKNVYWVGSTYALVKLNTKEFEAFKDRYNSYKRTPNIPEGIELEKSICFVRGEFQAEGPNVNLVIQGPNRADDLKEVKRTSFKFGAEDKNVSLYSIKGTLAGYNSKYDRIIEKFRVHKALNEYNPIRCYEGSELKAVVMPVRLSALPMAKEYAIMVQAELPERG